MRSRGAPALLVAASLIFAPLSAHGEVTSPPATAADQAEARRRFDRGLELFEASNNAGALAEFERAYALAPNPKVLFNIALVHAASGHSVLAVEAFERLLSLSEPLPPELRRRAEQEREVQLARVATLDVITNVPALVEVDTLEAGRTPLRAPLRLTSGEHTVSVVAPGYLPARRAITLAEASHGSLSFTLVRAGESPAELAVRGRLDGVQVTLDGTARGTTPLASTLSLSPGRHVVALSRPGYRTSTHTLELAEGTTTTLDASLAENPAAPRSERGRVVLSPALPALEVTLDGVARGEYLGPIDCPIGSHELRLSRVGFERVTRRVEVVAGRDTNLSVAWQLTAEGRSLRERRAESQRFWGFASGAAGVAFLAFGSYSFITGRSQLRDANAEIDALNLASVPHAGRECDPATVARETNHCDERLANASTRADQGILKRTLGLVSLGVGTAGLATGAVLLLTAGRGRESARGKGTRFSDISLNLGERGLAVTGRF